MEGRATRAQAEPDRTARLRKLASLTPNERLERLERLNREAFAVRDDARRAQRQ